MSKEIYGDNMNIFKDQIPQKVQTMTHLEIELVEVMEHLTYKLSL